MKMLRAIDGFARSVDRVAPAIDSAAPSAYPYLMSVGLPVISVDHFLSLKLKAKTLL